MFDHIRQWFVRTCPQPCHNILHLENLEERSVPAGLFVTGVGGITQPTDPEVTIYRGSGSNQNRQLGIQLDAFGGTTGDTRVALGDVNGDGTDDIIAAGGLGSTGEVAIFDGASALHGVQLELTRFIVYSNFAGGVHVAAGDFDHDGFAEVITTPGLGGSGHLKIFSFNDGTGRFTSTPNLITSAFTFGNYNGEVRVAALIENNGLLIATASGAGIEGDVRIFNHADQIGFVPPGTLIRASFLSARVVPFGFYAGGLSVAGGDTDGDGNDELFVTRNDGVPNISIYNVNDAINLFTVGIVVQRPLASIDNVFPGFRGAIHLGAADLDGDGRVEVLATTGFSGDPQGTPVKAFSRVGTSFTLVNSFYANPGYQAGAWLAGKDFRFSPVFTLADILNSDNVV